MNRNYIIQQFQEWKLFMKMFSIAKREFNGQKLHIPNSNTLNKYADLLGDVCGKPKKYKFLKELVMVGALVPKGTVKYSGVNYQEYVIHNRRLYDAFHKTQMAREVYHVFDDFAVIFDFFKR